MTVATYTTDLLDIELAESVTNWSALGGGGAGLAADPDFAIQGTNSVNKQVSGALKGQVYTAASVTIGTDDHFFVWLYATTPGLLDTLANGGMRVTMGTSTANFVEYYVRGAAEYAEGGWICFPVKYQTTAPSPGRLLGTPGASPTVVGGEILTTASVKAVNFGVDASRIGTGIDILYGDGADPEATFTAAADKNDLVANRWGVLTNKPGGFALQGKLRVGSSTVACELTESGKLITITDTPFTATDFTEIILENASTIFDLTGFTFLGLGTNNKGAISTLNTPKVLLESCIFKDFGAIDLSSVASASVLDNCEFNNTGLLTLGINVSMTGCIVKDSVQTSAISRIHVSNTQFVDFISSGSGHAIEITSVVTNPQTLAGCTFTGYAGTDGSTGNEAVFVNVASGSLTIRISSGGDTPTIRTAGATVTVENAPVITALYVKRLDTDAGIQNARVYMVAAAGGPLTIGTVIINSLSSASGLVFDSRSWDSDQPVEGWVRSGTNSPYYKQANFTGTIAFDSNTTMNVKMIEDT